MLTHTHSSLPSRLAVLGLLLAMLLPAGRAAAISYTWKATPADASWNTAGNWMPEGVPTAADDVTINACTTCPLLAGPASVNSLTLNGGILNLGGFTLSVAGNAAFNRGEVNNGSVLASGPSTTFGTSTGGCTMRATVTANSQNITFQYSLFHKPVYLTRTANVFAHSIGGNEFLDLLEITNQAGGAFNIARETRDIYRGSVSLTLASSDRSSTISLAQTEGNLFRGDIIFKNNGREGGIYLGKAVRSVLLGPGARIRQGDQGYTGGGLYIKGLEQEGNAPQTLQVNTYFALGPSVVFNGSVDIRAAILLLETCTFNGVARLEKYVSTYHDAHPGGNVFKGITQVINTSNRQVFMGVTHPDTFVQDVIITNTGRADGCINMAFKSAGSQFNGNIIINSTGYSWDGISFGANGGTAQLAPGKQLLTGTSQNCPPGTPGTGIIDGPIRFYNFRQLGITPQQLNATGNAQLYLWGNTRFEAPVSFTFPLLFLNGATFMQQATFIKTGKDVDNSNGNNKFFGKLTLRNQGPAGSAINMATQASDEINPPPAP